MAHPDRPSAGPARTPPASADACGSGAPTDLAQRLRLRAEALARADALRRAALDDLWRGANALLADAAQRSLRSASRLARRLARHRALRRPTLRLPQV